MMWGILLGLALLMYGAMKGWTIAVIAPLCALLAALTAGESILPMYLEKYMVGAGNYVINWFPMFWMGALFGEVMKVSGGAQSIARKLIDVIGVKNVVLAMMIAIATLVIGGVSVFAIVFVIYPLMLMCFKEGDIPRNFMPGVLIGGVIVSESSFPGNPQIQNIIPTTMLGVDPMAAPFMGYSAFIIMFIIATVYLNWEINKAKSKGLGFVPDPSEENIQVDEENMPNFWLALLPIVLIIVLLNVVKLHVVVSMTSGIILTILLFYKNMKGKIKSSIGQGTANSYPAIMNTALAVGFGGVIQVLPGFQQIIDGLDAISGGNPYMFAFIAVNLMAGFAGSASGGMTIALNAVGDKLLATGANPEALARVVAVSSVGLDSLPHNGAIITMLTYCKVTHKEGYMPMFIVSVIVPLIAGLYCVVLGNLMY